MGCGNNKISRSYLTSQPISTPSARATKASVADLGAQILRLAAKEMEASARRAEKPGNERVAEAKAAAKKAAREVAERKAKKKKDEDEAEMSRRFLMTTGRHVDAETFSKLADRPLRLPGQPEKTLVVDKGKTKLLNSYVLKIDQAGNLNALVDADGNYTASVRMHLHTIVKTDGSVIVLATDRRNGEADHFAKATISVPDAPQGMYEAAFEIVADLLKERA